MEAKHKVHPQTADLPPEADGQPRWRRTLYAMWAAELTAIVGFSFAMPFIPFYIRELGVTEQRLVLIWAGILGTAPGLLFAAFAPIWGSLADKYGRKMMVMRAMFGGAVLLTLMGMVNSVSQLLVLRLLQGMVTGTVAAAAALVSSITPSRRLGYSLGLMQTAVFAGMSVGPLLGGMTADRFGYRITFRIAGAFLLLGGCVVLWGAKERFSRPSPEVEQANGGLRKLAHNRGFPTMLAVFFLINLGATIVAPIFPLFVEKLAGPKVKAATATGLILAVSGLVAAITASIIGRLGDRVGHKKVLTGCTLFSGLFCIPQAFALGAGGTGPTVNAIIAKIAPRDSYGKAYGLAFSVSRLGGAVGPLLGGLVASQLGLRIPFVIMGVLLVMISLVVALRVKEI